MRIVQTIDSVRDGRIGAGGIPEEALAASTRSAREAARRLRDDYESGRLPLLHLPSETADLAEVEHAATRLGDAVEDIVFLGAGGSSLGGQTLCQLADYAVPGLGRFSDRPRLHFLDNLDPRSFFGFLQRLPLATARFVAVSKSGGTGETLLQTMAILTALREADLPGPPGRRFLGLSEPAEPGRRNALRALLEPEGVVFLDHHTGIGGRFSVLTNVGLLPATFAGLDIRAIRAGAGNSMAAFLRGGVSPAEQGASANLAAMAAGKGIAVMMGYADRFERFARWWVQLWAESLGKDGKGSQPVGALGPVDQHSQQQLYLAGPRDKLFTVLTVGTRGIGQPVDKDLAERAGEAGFAWKTIGDFVAAQARAMIDTFAKNGCPVRHIHIEKLDEEALGELLMHFMLETILTGYALGIDPFDQPAVEEAKLLAKRYLSQDG